MQARLDRAFEQRLYLITSDISSLKFVVLGSTSNVYNVSFDQGNCACTCPDFKTRNNICKHLLFIVHRVVKVPLTFYISNPIDLQQFQGLIGSINQNVQAPNSIVDAYSQAMVAAHMTQGSQSTDEEDCPICMEALDEKQEELCSCTKQCNKKFHVKCIEMWKGVSASNGLKCPMCRAAFTLLSQKDTNHINLACSVCLRFQPQVAYTHVDADCDLCKACFHDRQNVDASRHRNSQLQPS